MHDVFPSKYLKAADLGDISSSRSGCCLRRSRADGKEQQKIVLYFLGRTKESAAGSGPTGIAFADIAGDDTGQLAGQHDRTLPG